MLPHQMNHDPQGYYERLELDWDASPEAIHAAYRRKARILHPDIPGTGSAAAFMAVKEAYDVLADPLRRSAYDRAARSLDQLRSAMVADTAEVIHPVPPPPPPVVRTRGPRLSDLPLAVWAGLGIIALLAGGEAVLHLNAPPPADNLVEVPATAPTVTPQVPPAAPHPLRLAGVPNVYVIPSSSPALVLRYDQPRNVFVPIGQLPAFSAAQAVRVLRDHGLVEIRLTDTANGFIDASRVDSWQCGKRPAGLLHLQLWSAADQRRDSGAHRHWHRPDDDREPHRPTNGGKVARSQRNGGGDGLPGAGGRRRGRWAASRRVSSRLCHWRIVEPSMQRFCRWHARAALCRVGRTPGPGALTIPPDFPGQPPPVDISDQDFEHD